MNSIQLYYDEIQNTMIDCDGAIIFNIFDYVSPNQYFLFKQEKDYMIMRGVNNRIVELIWPEHDET